MGIEGTWYNELGSILNIEPVASGQVVGTYETAVSSSGCAQGLFAVAGRTDVDSGGQTVGFAVTWSNDAGQCKSTTSWAGQYQLIDGVERLTAMWLLVMAEQPAENWASTLIGEDVFDRQAPPIGSVAAAGKRHAHP